MNLKTSVITIIVLFALFIPNTSIAQIFEEFEVDKDESKEEVKEPVNIDPSIKIWQISDYNTFQDSLKLDTLLDNYQIYNPALKNSITSTYLGNYGTPALSNDFFGRNSNVDFFFLKSREVYLLTPAIVQYHNTKTPYTRLDFGQTGNKAVKNETRFNFLHTQNVNPYLNFTLQINMAKSAGQYNAQESKNNFITLYSSYNRDNINIYSGFITNTIKNNENGGITKDSLLLEVPKSELINTNLEASTTNLKSTYYFVNGEYRFGKIIETEKDSGLFRPIFGIYIGSQYERNQQRFSDNEEAKNTFFEHTYYGNDYITDSIRFNKLEQCNSTEAI